MRRAFNAQHRILLTYLPSPFEKKWNNQDVLSSLHVNSGFTSFSDIRNEILLFRKEECRKVLIHELIHAFCLHCPHGTVASSHLHDESIVEAWATILNCLYNSFHFNNNFVGNSTSKLTNNPMILKIINRTLSYILTFIGKAHLFVFDVWIMWLQLKYATDDIRIKVFFLIGVIVKFCLNIFYTINWKFRSVHWFQLTALRPTRATSFFNQLLSSKYFNFPVLHVYFQASV